MKNIKLLIIQLNQYALINKKKKKKKKITKKKKSTLMLLCRNNPKKKSVSLMAQKKLSTCQIST